MAQSSKKNYPLIIEGGWDGETDSKICSINYIKKHIENIKKQIWMLALLVMKQI